jgi:hypothetical protein
MNNLIVEELTQTPHCNGCNAEFTTQKDVDKLEYIRTTATSDIYRCPFCKYENIQTGASSCNS